MYKIFSFVILSVFLSGCSFFQGMRGLPARETPEPPVPARTPEAKPLVKQPPAEKKNADSKALKVDAKALKVDPGFDGINTNSSQAEYDALLARKKRDIFSLKGEDKPIRSIKGSNAVEAEELNKIYDDLEKNRNSGSSVFKFY